MNRPTNFIRYMILNEFYKGSIESQAVQNIRSVYGQESVKESECQFWYERFRSGDESLEGQPEMLEDDETDEAESKNRSMQQHNFPVEESAVEVKKAKRTEIFIASEVLQTILKWIKLKERLSVTMTNRRFRCICEDELDTKKHHINSLQVVRLQAEYTGSGSGVRKGIWCMDEKMGIKLIINRASHPYQDWQFVPFAEVAPPKNFTLMRRLELVTKVNGKFDEATLKFVRAAKPLFKDHFFTFRPRMRNARCLDNDLLTCLDNCFAMNLNCYNRKPFTDAFKQPAILNYTWINVSLENFRWHCKPCVDFSPIETIFEWLHTPPELDPNHRRQISLNLHSAHYDNLSCESLIEKFLLDDTPHTYLILLQAGLGTFVEIDLENPSTGEVLFTRKLLAYYDFEWDDDYNLIVEYPQHPEIRQMITNYKANKANRTSGFELIRCPKEAKESMKFERINYRKSSGVYIR